MNLLTIALVSFCAASYTVYSVLRMYSTNKVYSVSPMKTELNYRFGSNHKPTMVHYSNEPNRDAATLARVQQRSLQRGTTTFDVYIYTCRAGQCHPAAPVYFVLLQNAYI